MRLIPGERYLFDTTVFRDFTYRRQTAVELIRQAGEPDYEIHYSFVTFWELKISDSEWSEDEQYILLKPFPMIGLHPDIGELAERMQHQLQEKNARRKDKLSLPEFNDCYIAASARIHDLRVVTRNHRHFPQFRDLGELSITVDLYEAT